MIPPRNSAVSHSKPASSLRAFASEIPRRVNHGGAAWLKRRGDELRQPQDGAYPDRVVSSKENSRLEEGEDAQITGSTRSLGRRLLGLNVVARAAEGLPTQSVLPVLRQLLPKRSLLSPATLAKA